VRRDPLLLLLFDALGRLETDRTNVKMMNEATAKLRDLEAVELVDVF
jgi:hypothetical protein